MSTNGIRRLASAFALCFWCSGSGQAQENGKPKDARPPRADYLGDALPEGALLRLGTERMRHPGVVVSLFFSPDGKSLVSTGRDDNPILWDVQTGKRTKRDDLPKDFYSDSIISSPDKRFAVDFKNKGTLFEFREQGEGKKLFERTHAKAWASVAFSGDGKLIIALNQDNEVIA